jgi:hypothetical protein
MKTYKVTLSLLSSEKTIYVLSEKSAEELLFALQRIEVFSCVNVEEVVGFFPKHYMTEEEMWGSTIEFECSTTARAHILGERLVKLTTLPQEIADRLTFLETKRHYGHIRVKGVQGYTVDMKYFENILQKHGLSVTLSDDGTYFWSYNVYVLQDNVVYSRECCQHIYREITFPVQVSFNQKQAL